MLIEINPYVAAIVAISLLAAYGFRLDRTFRIQARWITIESDRKEPKLAQNSSEDESD